MEFLLSQRPRWRLPRSGEAIQRCSLLSAICFRRRQNVKHMQQRLRKAARAAAAPEEVLMATRAPTIVMQEQQSSCGQEQHTVCRWQSGGTPSATETFRSETSRRAAARRCHDARGRPRAVRTVNPFLPGEKEQVGNPNQHNAANRARQPQPAQRSNIPNLP